MSTPLSQDGRPDAPTTGSRWQMLAGWSAIAAAILTVTGLLTLLAFFGTGSAMLGR